MFHYHNHCRACGYAEVTVPDGIKAERKSEALVPVFDLGLQPLANDFRREGQECAGYAPLKVLLCSRCHLAQLSVVVRPEILYRHYLYVTSPSETMRDHFKSLWATVSEGRTVNSVLEIGSNDGTLLAWLQKEHRIKKTLGIDPAQNLAEEARKKGVDTISGMFNRSLAESMTGEKPDIIIARHVLCHIDDWPGFFAGIDLLCRKDTLVCIEVPYVADMLDALSFDQIYHEHLSYLSITGLRAALAGTHLFLQRVIHYPIHGGAVLLMLRRKDCGMEEADDIETVWAKERVGAERWRLFSIQSRKCMDALADKVRWLRAEGKTVAGLGASAKSTVWVNACHFTRKEIAFIADTTPGKWYSTSPGSDIPITDEGAILREMPDYIVLFSWNYARECIRKNALYLSKGGKIIIPIPSLQIVEK